ncbi:response regulator transcription factor [Noviherbaspirillum denitrificans]|uniref:Two-component system response regulator n=1 Tax=Noviherbaspirillum denitrificans TaxID=1968433 RepID=A0A254THR0_9BURK|nr:response regulator transcription factor [Noviherbaspirillum denitrificans]OWW19218.1 hypothetical protein AYR66_06610 [Noviherbaspirillum denitrificans]
MRITVMDQDKVLAEAICATLRNAGHQASCTAEQPDGGDCDLLILDIEFDRALSCMHATRTVPVLLLAPRSAEDALVAGLAAGASDYLVKPVRHGEIALRVQVLLRRAYPERHVEEALQFGPYAFDTNAARIAREGRTVDVTQKEFDLALLFFRHIGRPLSRTYIREQVWPGESELPSRTLDTHVSRVRSKLGLRPENGYRLAPVYSFGYQLEQLSV